MSARFTAVLVGLAIWSAGNAASKIELEPAGNNIASTASLQNGAKYYVNYCLGCHSAKYVRYNRLAADLQLSEEQLVENLMFTGEQPFDTMEIAMRPEDAIRWFKVAPPDLSLIARSRGTDYLYTYLRSFYAAPERPTGVDNLVLPGTSMPHVLWELQGIQVPIYADDPDHPDHKIFSGFEIVRPGTLSPGDYDRVVRDIVNFLDYIGEPMQREREALGIRVIAFLFVFLVVAFLLKKEIWKDVK
jgi:ubiquinol-cytochrome c reductase cytochrome c1 subunit